MVGLGQCIGRFFRAGFSLVLCAVPVFCLPGSFPHPHGSLLNRVIIFKQINSIAEFFLS